MEKYYNYINAEWKEAVSGKYFKNFNPSNGVILGEFPDSGKEDIAMAQESADEAFKGWRSLTGPARSDYLLKIAEFLHTNKKEFAIELCNEMGKVFDECLGDVQEAIDMAVFCAGEGRRNLGMVSSSEHPHRFVSAFRQPMGVVGAITPWNYPMAMPAWKIFPALITGNTVILKPAEDTPLSAINLAKAAEYAGLPKGVLNIVHGYGENAGDALVNQRGVKLISFTGSTEVGMSIAEKCAHQNKRVALEMGGKNAVIVLSDADIDLAVKGILKSVFATSGQRCTSAGRIIVANRIKRTLIKKLLQEALKLKVGNGYDLDTDMGPIINKERLNKINKDVITAIKNGAELICGGKIATEDELHKGNFFEPTLLSNVSPEMEIAQKETFGPVAVILPFKNEKEALEIANNIPYGLTAAIFTKNINKAMHFSHNVEVGSLFVNTACVGAEINIPFGGLKASGNGFREGAHHMLDIYTEWKSLSIQY